MQYFKKIKIISNILNEQNIKISFFLFFFFKGFPGGSHGKESACNVEDSGSIPGSGKFPGEGNSNPLHCSGLENSMDRGVWQATVHGITKSRM